MSRGSFRLIILAQEIQQDTGQVASLDRKVLSQGFEKAADNVLCFLMTARNSDALDPDYGTSIPALLGSGALLNASDILYLEAGRATAYFRAAQQGQSIPPAERINAVTVADVLEHADWPGYSATYTVQTGAGTVTLALPLSS